MSLDDFDWSGTASGPRTGGQPINLKTTGCRAASSGEQGGGNR